MKALSTLLLGALLFAAATSSYANTDKQEALAKQAATAYQQKAYGQAIGLYQQILASGYESAPLYYNLGNACYRNNDIASGILYYEKALKLSPNDDDVQFNLEIARSRLLDKVDKVPELFFVKWWNGLVQMAGSGAIAIASLLALALTLVSALGFLTSANMLLRKTGFYAGMVSLLLWLLLLAISYTRYSLGLHSREAIVFDQVLNVKSSPDENSKDIFVLHEGTKVRLEDELGAWVEIKIDNGNKGWVKPGALKSI